MFEVVDQYALTGSVVMGFAAVVVCLLALWLDETPAREAVKEE